MCIRTRPGNGRHAHVYCYSSIVKLSIVDVAGYKVYLGTKQEEYKVNGIRLGACSFEDTLSFSYGDIKSNHRVLSPQVRRHLSAQQ